MRCQRNGHTCIYEATLIRTVRRCCRSLSCRRANEPQYDPLSKRVKQPLPRAAGRETVEMVHLGFMGDSSHQDSSSDSRSRSSTQANSPDLSPAVQPLHETALNDQLISHFFGSSMPGQYKGQLGWLPLVMAMPHKSVAVTRGLRAVALGRVGWLRRDEHLIACARRTYTEALKATQAELWDPRQQWNESTLVAMQLLRVYELVSKQPPTPPCLPLTCSGLGRIIPGLYHAYQGYLLLSGGDEQRIRVGEYGPTDVQDH